MKRFLVLLLLLLFGRIGHGETLSHPTSSQTMKEVENHVIERARERVLASGLINDSREVELVKSTRPALFYIYFGAPIADYKIHWKINDKESIVVHGRGNILSLEGAHIERRNQRG
jgi:hypothetical protein